MHFIWHLGGNVELTEVVGEVVVVIEFLDLHQVAGLLQWSILWSVDKTPSVWQNSDFYTHKAMISWSLAWRMDQLMQRKNYRCKIEKPPIGEKKWTFFTFFILPPDCISVDFCQLKFTQGNFGKPLTNPLSFVPTNKNTKCVLAGLIKIFLLSLAPYYFSSVTIFEMDSNLIDNFIIKASVVRYWL